MYFAIEIADLIKYILFFHSQDYAHCFVVSNVTSTSTHAKSHLVMQMGSHMVFEVVLARILLR